MFDYFYLLIYLCPTSFQQVVKAVHTENVVDLCPKKHSSKEKSGNKEREHWRDWEGKVGG